MRVELSLLSAFSWYIRSSRSAEWGRELPPPSRYPRRHRELLLAIVSVVLGIGVRKVNVKALDSAYSIVFPKSTPINISKKARTPKT